MCKLIRLTCCLLTLVLLSACAPSFPSDAKTQFSLQKKSEHVLVYCSDKDSPDAEEIANTLEEEFRNLTSELGVSLPSQIKVTVYPSINEFHKASGLSDAPDWFICSSKKNHIYMTALDYNRPGLDHDANRSWILNQAGYELVKVITEEINQQAPVYLKVGIAAYKKHMDGVADYVLSSQEDGTFPSLKQLQKMKENDESEMCRAAYTIAGFIIEKYGHQSLTAFIKNPKDFKKLFGTSEEEFENKWMQYVEESYPSLDLRKETAHFTFAYSESDRESIDTVIQALEENYERVTTNLQTIPAEKCRVSVYPDMNSLHKTLQNPISRITGFTDGPNSIKIMSPNSYNYPFMLPVHEFTHVVIQNLNPNDRMIPAYLNEGTAAYEADQEQGVAATIIPHLRDSTLPSIEALTKMTDEDGLYQYGYAFVRYIVEEYGYGKLVELLKNPDISSVFGISEEEFHKNWVEFLVTIY